MKQKNHLSISDKEKTIQGTGSFQWPQNWLIKGFCLYHQKLSKQMLADPLTIVER